MKSATVDAHRAHWLAQAKSIARRVNCGWWLEAIAAPSLVVSALGAAGLLLIRSEWPAIAVWQLLAATCGGAIILGLIGWWWAARRFETPAQSLVRIEVAMMMQNSLSTANAGAAAWPEARAVEGAGLKWQWPRLLTPPFAALALLAAGVLIPISPRLAIAPAAQQAPQAWQQLSSELEELAKDAVVDEKYLEETAKRLDDLKSQDEQEWFSHASLEATDSLKKSHAAEMERLTDELGQAMKALDSLEKTDSAASDSEKNQLLENFDQALKNLESGTMKPNPELLAQLQQLDPKELADLSPEQLAELQKNLKKSLKALKKAKGKSKGKEESESEGDSEGEGEGQDDLAQDGERNTGQGTPDRGPGHSPKVLGKEKDPLETGALAGLEATDLSHSLPGDLLELQDGEHEVDRSASKTSTGGEIEATGKGGDRVWRDSLAPAEQRTLKRFFE